MWVRSLQRLPFFWSNLFCAKQIVVLTATTLNVFDTRLSKLIEHVPFDGLALVSPTLSSTVNGLIPYADSVGDIAHSIRVYKGKIFLLVGPSRFNLNAIDVLLYYLNLDRAENMSKPELC